MGEAEVILQMERESRAATERVLTMLREAGRDDLAADLVGKLKDVRSGLNAARSIWHSITEAQRKLLLLMEPGRVLVLPPHSRTRYHAKGAPGAIDDVCGIATVRALCSRELLAPDGPAVSPEDRIILTDHGRFVLSKGRSQAGTT